MIGTREPSGGDNVQDDKRTKIRNIPLLVVERNSVGRSKDKEVQVKRMNNKKARGVIVATHPKKNMSTTREYEEEDV